MATNKSVQKRFAAILQIEPRRLQRALKQLKANRRLKEQRGGDRKLGNFAIKKRSIMDFIRKLKGCEAHYGREKSKRIYMTSELNLTKLWRLYNEAHIDQVFIFYLDYFHDILLL